MKSFLIFLIGVFTMLLAVGASVNRDVAIKAKANVGADSLKNNSGKDSVDLGIGPVKALNLDKLDSAMAQDGQSFFSSECSDCHDVTTDQSSGPSVKTFTRLRNPVFIMNYLLNTDEMNEKDPAIKESITKYGDTPMPSVQLTEQQARALLEYFRSIEK